MSIQFSCDRCKKPIESRSIDISELPDALKLYGQFHLCNSCAGKLKSFIEEPQLWHKSDE